MVSWVYSKSIRSRFRLVPNLSAVTMTAAKSTKITNLDLLKSLRFHRNETHSDRIESTGHGQNKKGLPSPKETWEIHPCGACTQTPRAVKPAETERYRQKLKQWRGTIDIQRGSASSRTGCSRYRVRETEQRVSSVPSQAWHWKACFVFLWELFSPSCCFSGGRWPESLGCVPMKSALT